MADKRTTADRAIAHLADGMTIGIGGWGSRRKPLALVRAILRSPLRDLTVVSFAGPDLGMLCAAGKVKRAVYGFASLDSIPLEPYFRAARQAGSLEASEIDEGMLQWGLYAAALRLPFLPTRAGLGSDALALNPWLRTVRSPYDDGEELVAMRALELDAALVHVHRADASGNTLILGPDPFFDELFCMAAKRRIVSCERVVSTAELSAEGPLQGMRVHRGLVDHVVEAPRGAAFTSCDPDYPRDEEAQRAYVASAAEPGGWAAFAARYLPDTPDGGAR
jgi:glutaconate CoA-transferase subunit A